MNFVAQEDEYRGILHLLHRIISGEGLSELYRGLDPSTVGVIFYVVGFYDDYESLKAFSSL